MIKELLKVSWAKENQTIREHTDCVLAEANRLIQIIGLEDARIIKILKIVCEYHDYGKLNQGFQKRIKKAISKKRCAFNKDLEIPHNILSYYFLDSSLFDKRRDYDLAACAIVYHHYHGDVGYVLKNQEDLIKKLLLPFQDELEITKLMNQNRNSYSKLLRKKDKEEIFIKGLFHRCDYSASAGIPCEIPNTFLQPGLERLLNSWKEKQPDVSWNELQSFCKSHREDNLMITAPTGMGKTEAGLLWIGNQKGFFVLPLRTAINAMYDRVCDQIADQKRGEVALLHSDMLSYYFQQGYENTTEEDLLEYSVRSRQMALPLTVCTPDQIFDFVHQYPGYEYKLATLSYSKVIIDEIQMYDPELLAYLIYGIKRIHEMGGKIAVLTATLPPFVKMKLKEILGEQIAEANFSNRGIPRHNVQVVEKQLNVEDIISFCDQLDAKEEKSRKILVVCNSIEIAQELYENLSDSKVAEEYCPQLLHSHFIKKDRKKKEEAILKTGQTFQQDGAFHCENKIWITTSIVEASLDIDFDYLFTELMDLMSLFQRLGRCNRKGKKDFSDYNCFVFTEKQGKAMNYVDQDIYRLSKEAILTKNGILTEEEKDQMIQEALSVEKLEEEKCDYIDKYDRCYQTIEDLYTYERNHESLRNIDSVQVIPSPVYEKYQEEILSLESYLLNPEIKLGDRLKAREALMQFTLSISKGQFNASKTEEKTVAISSKQKIPVLQSEYSEQIGFRYIKEKKDKKTTGIFL